jgi:pyrimidine and pyridine-specific 5'-nucleotidase
MLPSDISEQIRVLDKYARSAFDIVGLLPKEISINILKCLTVYETLKLSTVSLLNAYKVI